MATRPDNHIIGDKAIRRISDILIPEGWTIDTPDSDYGLDMLIEVVINNKTTGKFFFIQSKGTLDSSYDGVITYSLSVERIEDYHRIELPVLFVYYSITENKFWGRWMNGVYNSLTLRQKTQDTVTLRFSSHNLIDADYLKSIGPSLDSSITDRVSLYCDSISEDFKRLHLSLFSISHQLLGKDITDDTHLTCESILLSYEGTPQKGFIIVCSQEVSVRIPVDLESYDFLYFPAVKQEELPDSFLDAVYVIAFLSSKHSSQCLDYVLSYPRQTALDYFSLDEWIDLFNRLHDESIDRVAGIFDVAVQNKHDEIAQFLLIVVFRASMEHDRFKSLYRQLLSSYLRFECGDEFKGRLCYNLANSMRDENLYESSSLYFNAVKFNPEYRRTFYWWQEVGGVLYLLDHFLFAEQFYKKARRLAKEMCREDIGILISDCLICQGKIKDAIEEERNYLDASDSVCSRIQLKNIISETMDGLGISIFDPVFWFNQGIKASKEGNHKESLKCFLFAWRLDDGDIEALVNAFIEAFNTQDTLKVAYIIDVLREQAPDEAYKKIVSIILSNAEPDKATEEIIDCIKKLFYSSN